MRGACFGGESMGGEFDMVKERKWPHKLMGRF